MIILVKNQTPLLGNGMAAIPKTNKLFVSLFVKGPQKLHLSKNDHDKAALMLFNVI